jgi:hypothetical protein
MHSILGNDNKWFDCTSDKQHKIKLSRNIVVVQSQDQTEQSKYSQNHSLRTSYDHNFRRVSYGKIYLKLLSLLFVVTVPPTFKMIVRVLCESCENHCGSIKHFTQV